MKPWEKYEDKSQGGSPSKPWEKYSGKQVSTVSEPIVTQDAQPVQPLQPRFKGPQGGTQLEQQRPLERALPAIGQTIGGVGGYALGGAVGHPLIGSAIGGTALGGAGKLSELLLDEARDSGKHPIQVAALKAKAMGINNILPGGAMLDRLAQLSPEREEALQAHIMTTAAVETLFAGAGAVGGKLKSIFPEIPRALGGIGKETVVQAKRIGMEKIVQPATRGATYVADRIVPRVQQGLVKTLSDFNKSTVKLLSTIGVSKPAVEQLRKTGIAKTRAVVSKYNNNLGVMSESIDAGLTNKLKQAGSAFDIVLNKSGDKSIGITPAIKRVKNELISIGAMDKKGNRIAGKYGHKSIDGLYTVYKDMLNISNNGKNRLSKEMYSRLKLRTEGLIGDNKALNRHVYNSLAGYRDSAVKSIPGLKKANAIYSQAKSAHDIYYGKSTQRLLERRDKWGLKQLKDAKKLDELLPNENKFLNDLNIFSRGKEVVDKVNTVFGNAKKTEAFVNKLSNYEGRNVSLYRETSDILNSLGDTTLADDALAHYLSLDLFQPKVSTGLAGGPAALRKGAEALTRFRINKAKYFESPISQALQKGASGTIGRALPVGITSAITE